MRPRNESQGLVFFVAITIIIKIEERWRETWMLVSRSGLPLNLKSIGETQGGRKRDRRGQRARRGERDDKRETWRRKKRDKERGKR